MKNLSHKIPIFFLLFILSFGQWISKNGGNFEDKTNWKEGKIPTDNATISETGNYDVFINSKIILNSLTIGGEGSSPKLIIRSGSNLELNTCTIQGAVMEIEENASLLIKQSLEATKIDITSSNQLVINGSYKIEKIDLQKGTLTIDSKKPTSLPPVRL